MKKFYSFLLLALFTITVYNAQTTHTINTGSYYYTPSTLTIDVGDSVIWINDGGNHDVNGDINSITNQPFNNPVTFDSPTTSTVGAVIFAFKFTVAGTYNYDCSVGSHASAGMVGSVIVNAQSNTDLVIQGAMDLNAPSNSNDGKAIHFVANANITDLSVYGFNVSNNGGGSDGVEWSFPIGSSASAGDNILVYRVGTDPNFFSNYFGSCFSAFEQTFTDASLGSVLSQNGDDPMELFLNGVVVDNYGDVNASAMPGDPYEDSWAYRNSDGSWLEGGEDCDVESPDLHTVSSSGCPYPLCPAASTDLVITTEVCGPTDSNTVVTMDGPFWGWGSGNGPLAINNGDGTFTFTFSPAPTADMEYKFILDGVQEDLVASGTASGNWSCTPVTDYSSYANRQWLTTDPLTLSGLVYGSCDPCSPPPPPPASTILGTWKLSSQLNSLALGPNQGSTAWWSINTLGGGSSARPCQFDDSLTFYADGTYDHFMDSLTWLETWQAGSPVEGCGVPIAPHNGGLNTYSYSNDSLTVYGSGAHVGLSKVHNGGEDGMPTGDSIVYQIEFSGQNNEIATLDISFPNAGGVNGLGWWRFIYIKTNSNSPPPVSNDLVITTEVCDSTDSNTVVRLTGPFWGFDPLGGPVGSANGDGTFTFTFSPAPSADMEYLFVLDGVQEDLVASGIADSNWSCTPVTDYFSYANRQWLTTDTLVLNDLVYGSCSPCLTSTDISNNIESSIVLYPNPVNNVLNISSSNIIKSYDVKDLLGRVIYSSSEINSNNISLNTSSFSNNVYLVSCIVNDQLIIKKIIISR
jgi:plastocyanin